MLRTPSDVARLFDVERDVVKRWAYEFKDYLSKAANPPKGERRLFEDNDILVLAYAFEHWEDNPDIECINIGLNKEEFNESRYKEWLYLNTPIFQDIPDDIDETWRHGFLYNGSKTGDPVTVARSYKIAAIALIDDALKDGETHEFDYPVLYLCRHTIELYLKLLGKVDTWTHDLDSCMKQVENEFNQKITGMVKTWINEFHEMDEKGTAFRYSDNGSQYVEYWVDLIQLKAVITELCKMFEAVIYHDKS